MGRVVYGASCLWGELSLGRVVHGASCPWGELSMGRVVVGRVLMGRVVRGASCLGASGPGTGKQYGEQLLRTGSSIVELSLAADEDRK